MAIDESFMCGWLAGFIDGEGHVRFRDYPQNVGKRGRYSYYVAIFNTDKRLINTATYFLNRLGIRHWTTEQRQKPGNRKDLYGIHISRGVDLLRLRSKIPLAARQKQIKLNQIAEYVSRWRSKYNPDRLNFWHNEERISLRNIAKMLGLKEGAHYRLGQLLRQAGYGVRVERPGRPKAH